MPPSLKSRYVNELRRFKVPLQLPCVDIDFIEERVQFNAWMPPTLYKAQWFAERVVLAFKVNVKIYSINVRYGLKGYGMGGTFTAGPGHTLIIDEPRRDYGQPVTPPGYGTCPYCGFCQRLDRAVSTCERCQNPLRHAR